MSFYRDLENGCFIHLPQVQETHLVVLKDYESWETLYRAAEIRNYMPILDIGITENSTPDNISYHAKCRARFTLKRELDKIVLEHRELEELENFGNPEPCTSTRPARSKGHTATSNILPKECIFCKKVSWRFDKIRPLSLVESFNVAEKIKEIAVMRKDHQIMEKCSRDLIAIEAHYHKFCYTKGCQELQQMNLKLEPKETSEQQCRISDVFQKLFVEIRKNVILQKKCMLLSNLRKQFSILLSEQDLEFTASLKASFSQIIQVEFGDQLRMFSNKSSKLVVVPHTAEFDDIVEENMELQKVVNDLTLKDIGKAVQQAALFLRSEIKSEKRKAPFPYHPENVDENYYAIPQLLEEFLKTLLTGDPKCTKQSQRVEVLTKSFSQDLVYAVSNGRQVPPKHFLLPYAVKTLTGNIELITRLNKLGHGVSYSTLEENDTGLCLQKLAAAQNQRVILPASIKMGVFTNLAWDNIDRLEETLTGKGTSHRVNGIAVQKFVPEALSASDSRPVILRSGKRTLDNAEDDLLEPYIIGNRVGPEPRQLVNADERLLRFSANVAAQKDLVWILLRLTDPINQIVPAWTGFNIKTRQQQVVKDVVGYLPTINAPPTELTTVFEVLQQSEKIRQQLNLPSIVIVMDQALYAKAAEIMWQRKQSFENIVLRLGTFHTICNMFGIIGKRFMDAGLKDICIESGIVAEGSINGVLTGKMYNRAVRVHKCIYEALMRLMWMKFEVLIEERHRAETIECVGILRQVVTGLKDEINQETFQSILESAVFRKVYKEWEDYLQWLREDNGLMSRFWMTYVDMVGGIILGLIRGAREGNWQLHLSAVRSMIPWCFAYNHQNYARFLPFYLEEMMNLQSTHPQIQESFMEGNFSVQLSSNNSFGKIPVDQTTEVTINKDTQTPGGTSRFSLKSAALKRYYIVAEHRSAFLSQFREYTHAPKAGSHHSDLHRPRVLKDEEDVAAIVSLFGNWTNPFDFTNDIVSISTAKQAPSDVVKDLIRAEGIGQTDYQNFRKERIGLQPTKKFFDPIPRNKLKSFSDLGTTKRVRSADGRSTILKADRELFSRIIVISQIRDLNMADVLRYPLGPIPWALASADGLLKKTNKSALAHKLQEDSLLMEDVPSQPCVVIIDAMALVQKLVIKPDIRYNQMAMSLFRSVLSETRNCARVDVVFDVYKENSIKDCERALRTTSESHLLLNIQRDHVIRQWKTILSSSRSKKELIRFLFAEWQFAEYKDLLGGLVMHITCENVCVRINKNSTVMKVDELCSSHEEADGRMMLHADNAIKSGFRSVIIASEDTDVFICMLAFCEELTKRRLNQQNAALYQKCGTRLRRKLINVSTIHEQVGENVSKALLGMHAFTGCDTVSAFAGRGKVTALKMVKKSIIFQETFQLLGQEFLLTDHLLKQLEKFTCQLYAKNTNVTDINQLRYNLFCAKKGTNESHQLPPCKNTLEKHCQRANYQTAVWRRSLEANPVIPSPYGHGWKQEDGKLVVEWMSIDPAPSALMELLTCNCAAIKSAQCAEGQRRCVCRNNGMKCTDMCQCSTDRCNNQASRDEETPDFDGEETDSEED